MDTEWRALTNRSRAEAVGSGAQETYDRVFALACAHTPQAREELAQVLVAARQPLWARELAAHVLGRAGDRRAFEPLVLLLNHRDPARGASAAQALAQLGDPRTPRAAAALATNPLRTAYALHPVRLLVALRAPESVPALLSVLTRLVVDCERHEPVVRACVTGLGELGDRRAVEALTLARSHPRLRDAATSALARIGAPARGDVPGSPGH